MQVRIRMKSIAAMVALLVSYVTVLSVPTGAVTAATLDVQETYTAESYEAEDWWKAELTEYTESLAPVSYETTSAAETNTDENFAEDTVTTTVETTTEPEVTTAANTTLAAPVATEPPVVQVQAGTFVFSTYGYGHGVGLSQNGANYYANYAGWNYQQILLHYFPGTAIMNTGTAATEQITVNGVTGNVLDLVSQVVYNEVGPSMNTEAIKAQTVAAYTYIKYHGNNGKDLRRKANPPANVVSAVQSVLGEAVYYNGAFALTSFYASSGGASASCKDVFYQDMPYLRSVPSEYDAASDPHYGSQKVYAASELKRVLEAKLGIKLSADPASWIQIVEGDGGYAASVIIDNQVALKGNTFRNYLGLKSPKIAFTFEP